VSVAFAVVFGVFVAAMLVIATLAVRWGRRRDRAARERLGARRQSDPSHQSTSAGDGSMR
jgi:hypothetical protein